MFFFFKKKDVVLDCFTHSTIAYDHAKIDYAKNHYPDWWKDQIERNEEDWPTIKFCAGLKNYYNKGIVIPSWFEMKIEMNEDGIYKWYSSNKDVDTNSSHPQNQFYSFAQQDGHNIKLTSPWSIRTKEEIYFTWNEPTWNWREMMRDIRLLPGVLSFKYQNATNINLFIQKVESGIKVYTIEPMKPLVIMHPMADCNIVIKNHLITKDEWVRIHNYGAQNLFIDYDYKGKVVKSTRRNNYVKKLIDGKDKECPFHK